MSSRLKWPTFRTGWPTSSEPSGITTSVKNFIRFRPVRKSAIARRHREEFDFGGVAKPLIAAGIIAGAAGLINVVAS